MKNVHLNVESPIYVYLWYIFQVTGYPGPRGLSLKGIKGKPGLRGSKLVIHVK